MVVINFTLIFYLFNLIISKENIFLYNSLEAEEKNIIECLVPIIAGGSLEKEDIICALFATKRDPDFTKLLISLSKESLINGITKQLDSSGLTALKVIVEDFFNDKNNSLTSLFDVINNNGTLIDYIVNIVNYTKGENETDNKQFVFILQNIAYILNIEEFDKVTNFLFEPEYIISISNSIGNFIKNSSFENIYYQLKPLILKYPVTLFRLVYNVIKAFNDRNKLIDTIAEFFYNNKNNQIIVGISDFVVDLLINATKKESISANLTSLNYIIEDFFNDKNNSLSSLFNIMKNNETLINYIVDIVNNNKEINQTDLVFKYIVPILNIEGFDNVTNFLYNPEYIITILNVSEVIFIKNTLYEDIYYLLKPIIMKYPITLFRLLYNIVKTLRNRNATIDFLEKFFLENKSSQIILDIRDILSEEKIRENLKKVFPVHYEGGDIIKEELFNNYTFIQDFFNIIYYDDNNGTIIIAIADLFRKYLNLTYMAKGIPHLFDLIYQIKPKYANDILDIVSRILTKLVKKESVDNFITGQFTKKLEQLFFGDELGNYHVSTYCKKFMQTVFFEEIDNLTQKIRRNNTLDTNVIRDNLVDMRYFYLEKVLIHSSKDQNDFLTFENCLDKDFDNTLFEHFNLNFTLQSVYVISIFDDKVNKSHFTDSMFYEKYDYLLSYCLPYGKYIKDGDEKEVCTKNDYGNITRIFMEIAYNMKNTTVDSVNIYDYKFKNEDYIIGAISLIILCIPIIIRIFLFVYSHISQKIYGKKEDINELILDDEENENISYESKINKKKDKKMKLNFPNWYKYLNEYFSIIKNGSELFDSNTKETLFNNVNGITYIKGLLGVSMILYIFGQTYLTLYNLPFKVFSLSQFSKAVKNPFYIILLIGLRYSPRIILSCSGYTLMYKYLSFIEQEQRFYLPKFYLLQSYKYILLILVVIFMRYSVYYLNIIFTQGKRPMLEILKYILEYSYDNSFGFFFSFLLNGYTGNSSFQWRQNLIQYFYVPINEVFLFIVFTLFISVGYKFKLRIDIILIIIALMIFIAKILIFVFYMYDNKKYPTLFYYLFDYGAFMLNPLYNMPSFLIGMFFGIINYSIQRGVSIYKTDKYQRIYSSFSINESETSQNENGDFIKRTTMKGSNFNLQELEIDNYNSKNVYYQQQQDEYNENNRSLTFSKEKNKKLDKKPLKKKKPPIYTPSFRSDDSRTETYIGELDPRIKEMPFLIWPTKFLNFHRQNEGKCYFKFIVFFFIILMLFFSCIHFFFVGKYCTIDENKDDKDKTLEKLSLQKVISNYTLNLIYVIDIDLVVFMTNWAFFILYSKGYKTAEIYDFFNNSFWSFFIKCYFSFIIIASPMILCVFYQSETVIKYTLINVILFSFIYIILIFIMVIIFYSLYEMPLKKIFKSFLKGDAILEENTEDEASDYYEMEEQTLK